MQKWVAERRSRVILKYFYIALAVILIGVLSRTVETGLVAFDKYVGDALYAMLIYLVLRFISPTGSSVGHLVIAALLVVAIESFQLTGLPLQWRQADQTMLKILSVLLGTKFGWLDLLSYGIGLAIIFQIDQQWLKPALTHLKNP